MLAYLYAIRASYMHRFGLRCVFVCLNEDHFEDQFRQSKAAHDAARIIQRRFRMLYYDHYHPFGAQRLQRSKRKFDDLLVTL